MALPNTPVFTLLRTCLSIQARFLESIRIRSYPHDLSSIETQYQLLTFGIPVQELPVTSTGKIKTKNHLQWIQARQAIEKIRAFSSGSIRAQSITLHARVKDVLFRRGGNTKHYGNMDFLYLLENHRDAFFNPVSNHTTKKAVIQSIIEQITSQGGRFLTLDTKMNWWTEITDVDNLEDRITSSFYYHLTRRRKAMAQSCKGRRQAKL